MTHRPCWTWASARSTGTAHLKAGKQCDDFASCVEVQSRLGPVLIAAVSDGAGSARYSSIGSRIAVRVFTELAVRHLDRLGSLRSLTQGMANEWIEKIRKRIVLAACRRDTAPREFAATLVAAIVSPNDAAFIHVGDGASVFRSKESAEWIVPTWPAQGEYASTTFFVTDDPLRSVQHAYIDQSITEIAVFSDGMERLALDFAKRAAHAPFFDTFFRPLQQGGAGPNRKLSRDLRHFLDGPSICSKTDDDKTLILAKRHTGVSCPT
jgi:protein phosphatase 2C-like protein